MNHSQYTTALRAIANWIDAHPEIPLPATSELTIWSLNEKEEASMLARALGTFDKRYANDLFYLEKDFGGIKLSAVFLRDAVCKKVVVGVREVPEHVLEARPEEVIPAHTEEIVEWQCGESLLAPSEE